MSNNILNNFPDIPMIDGKNYDNWCKQMRVLFGFKDVLEVAYTGLLAVSDKPTDT